MKKIFSYFILLLTSTAGFAQVFDNETKADVDLWAKKENVARQRIRDNKIHSIKTYSYKSDTSSESKEGYLSTELSYDDQGNLIEYKTFRKNGKIKFHYVYKWDREGRNLEFTNLRSNGNIRNRETNTYDVLGNRIDARTYGRTWLLNGKEKLWWHSTATFDERQNMLEQKFFFDSGNKKLFDRYVYTYYDDGSKRQTVEYSGKNKVRHTWNYDCKPVGISEVKNLKDTSKICVRYETDKDGNKIKITEENVKYGKIVRIIRKYDKSENVLEEISYDSKQRPYYHHVSVFDEKNNCTGYTVYERKSDKVRERVEVHYDTTGNMTERIVYKSSSVPDRILKYSYAR